MDLEGRTNDRTVSWFSINRICCYVHDGWRIVEDTKVEFLIKKFKIHVYNCDILLVDSPCRCLANINIDSLSISVPLIGLYLNLYVFKKIIFDNIIPLQHLLWEIITRSNKIRIIEITFREDLITVYDISKFETNLISTMNKTNKSLRVIYTKKNITQQIISRKYRYKIVLIDLILRYRNLFLLKRSKFNQEIKEYVFEYLCCRSPLWVAKEVCMLLIAETLFIE